MRNKQAKETKTTKAHIIGLIPSIIWQQQTTTAMHALCTIRHVTCNDKMQVECHTNQQYCILIMSKPQSSI